MRARPSSWLSLCGGAALLVAATVAGPASAQPASPSELGEPAGSGELAPPPSSEPARLEEPVAEPGGAEPAGSEWTEQALGGHVGVAFGGRTTAGGVRLSGSYLYRMSERDWFDGAVSFSIGSGDAACFRDRQDDRVCDHAAVDGFSVDFALAVRRIWMAKERFAPFARVGLGLRFARFSGDEVAGVAVPLLAGLGVSAEASARTRIVAAGQLELGGGWFSRGVGLEPQLGLGLTLGIEIALH